MMETLKWATHEDEANGSVGFPCTPCAPCNPVEQMPQPLRMQHMLHLPQPPQTLQMRHGFDLSLHTHHAHHTHHHHETLTLQRLWPASRCRFHLKLFLEGSRLGPLNEWRLSVLLSEDPGAVEAYRAVWGLEDLESSPPHSVLQRPSTPHSATQRPSKLPVDNGSTAPFPSTDFCVKSQKTC